MLSAKPGREPRSPNAAKLQSPSGTAAYRPGEPLAKEIRQAFKAAHRPIPGIRANDGESQNGDGVCRSEGQRKPLSEEPVYARSPSRYGSSRLFGWDLVKVASRPPHKPRTVPSRVRCQIFHPAVYARRRLRWWFRCDTRGPSCRIEVFSVDERKGGSHDCHQQAVAGG